MNHVDYKEIARLLALNGIVTENECWRSGLTRPWALSLEERHTFDLKLKAAEAEFSILVGCRPQLQSGEFMFAFYDSERVTQQKVIEYLELEHRNRFSS